MPTATINDTENQIQVDAFTVRWDGEEQTWDVYDQDGDYCCGFDDRDCAIEEAREQCEAYRAEQAREEEEERREREEEERQERLEDLRSEIAAALEACEDEAKMKRLLKRLTK